MKIEYILPIALILLDIGASIVYLFQGDWRKCLYWFFASGLTYVVTF
jgi:uncharacterized membrane protein YjjP (DUF1212 family)